MSAAIVLRAKDYRRMRWKNGAGWTSEVFRAPDADDWGWRLSIAEMETDAPFSMLPGVERTLVLLEGNGMRLHFHDADTRDLSPSSSVLHFAGDRPVVAQLIDGSSRDFNLMWKRDRVDAQLWRRTLAGAVVLFAEPGETWGVHLVAGQAHFPGLNGLGEMQGGDTAILRGPRRAHPVCAGWHRRAAADPYCGTGRGLTKAGWLCSTLIPWGFQLKGGVKGIDVAAAQGCAALFFHPSPPGPGWRVSPVPIPARR